MLLKQDLVQFFSVIPSGLPPRDSNALQYYIKHEKCKVNFVIFPSSCDHTRTFLRNKCAGTTVSGFNIIEE